MKKDVLEVARLISGYKENDCVNEYSIPGLFPLIGGITNEVFKYGGNVIKFFSKDSINSNALVRERYVYKKMNHEVISEDDFIIIPYFESDVKDLSNFELISIFCKSIKHFWKMENKDGIFNKWSFNNFEKRFNIEEIHSRIGVDQNLVDEIFFKFNSNICKYKNVTCHADLKSENYIIKNNVMIFIDFEYSKTAPYVIDVASFASYQNFSGEEVHFLSTNMSIQYDELIIFILAQAIMSMMDNIFQYDKYGDEKYEMEFNYFKYKFNHYIKLLDEDTL